MPKNSSLSYSLFALPWALSLTLLAGCGGGGSSSAAPATSTTTTPVAVTQALTVDFASLSNYAAPALPAYYDATVSALDNTPPQDPVDDKIATLGRVLFYDKQLSFNNTVSCASCHSQANGFDDSQRFSVGFEGNAFTTAHAMRLGNSRYYRPGDTFWDRRAESLEAQASQPIQNAIEMGFDAAHGGFAAVITKLQNLSYYPALFSFAFGDAAITEARVQRALAQFERAMVSTGSRWDAGYSANYAPAAPDRGLGTPIASFTAEENQGRALFMNPPNAGGAGCVGCHVAPTFSLAANSRSNGLDAGETVVFKSPSLKNVALSGAFMHDGRFATLTEVVEHYNSGVQAGPALDNRLIGPGGQPRRLNLTTAQKAALVAFMQTLTDTALVADAKFSTPFR
jgi:cytochrome c peroxidase